MPFPPKQALPALSFKKKALSAFIRNSCERQFRLNMYLDSYRRDNGMPIKQDQRAGLGGAGDMGYEWQEKKIAELEAVFGAASILQPKKGTQQQLLIDVLSQELRPHQFIVEASYSSNTDAFRQGMRLTDLQDEFGNTLSLGDNRADIIQVLPACVSTKRQPEDKACYWQQVHPDGTLTDLQPNDTRLRLRIIDIKLSSEPGANYFAEVIYYALTLAGWLQAHQAQFGHRFVIVAASAVWPGSHEASAVATARQQLEERGQPVTLAALATALEKDIELAPFDVFTARLGRIFRDDLPRILRTPWQQLDWHVDYSCSGCDFLGYPWPVKVGATPYQQGGVSYHKDWCWSQAEATQHLSRVAGVTRGNARQLGLKTVADLAALSTSDPLFSQSPTLKSQRVRFPYRAQALAGRPSGQMPDTGTDAQMPRWSDLRICLFLDYDLSSAFTIAFGIRASWREPASEAVPSESIHRKEWTESRDEELDSEEKEEKFHGIFTVRSPRLSDEKIELLKFLRALQGILKWVRERDDEDVVDTSEYEAGRRASRFPNKPPKRSSYQIYLWDEAQLRHLQRVISRHLPAIIADKELRDVAWLFPSGELLAHPEEASVRSAFTVVSRVVQHTVMANLPHHYTLYGVARQYNSYSGDITPPEIGTFYRDALSDLVPAERIHEVWGDNRNPKIDWLQTLTQIGWATRAKLSYLNTVVQRLQKDLRLQLGNSDLTAPELFERPKRALPKVPLLSRLLYEYTRLNAALDDLEAYTTRAMPVYEREAKFRAAYLPLRLSGADRVQALQSLQATQKLKLQDDEWLLIYELGPDSRDLNVRPGDIGFALSPRNQPGFLQQSWYSLLNAKGYTVRRRDGSKNGASVLGKTIVDAGLTSVTVEAIDRRNGRIALRLDDRTYVTLAEGYGNPSKSLESAGFVALSQDVVLDKVSQDFLSPKVKDTLEGIGFPEIAQQDPLNDLLALTLNTTSAPPQPPTTLTPAATFLWDTQALTQPHPRNLTGVRAELEPVLSKVKHQLNDSQWLAWQGALQSQLSLVWGPPGTGKSQTIRVLIAGALLAAHQSGLPLRVLVSTISYAALDNVLEKLPILLETVLPGVTIPIIRLQSMYKQEEPKEPSDPITQLKIKTKKTSQEVLDIQQRLTKPHGLIIVGGVPQQVHNLAIATEFTSAMSKTAGKKGPSKLHRATQSRWFDLVVIDEASQMDVATATLVVSKAADTGTYVLAGDDLQLPPIHAADPPEQMEHYVGSVFEFVRKARGVNPLSLDINYRSNAVLVDFVRGAGYRDALKAHSPQLRLDLSTLPVARPADWPTTLAWSADWSQLLNPNYSATAFVHTDDTSGQVNDFEADAVAALVWLLKVHLKSQLLHERLPNGTELPASQGAYSNDDFWDKAIGIVTPHRAQMSRIVTRLQAIFHNDNPEKIRAAVDTVERFQGQQRDMIIASFGIGDPDLIRSEDEFLYNLRRFNVLASRARAKLIVLTSQALIDHLPNDAQVLEESRLLKRFVETFCRLVGPLELPYYRTPTDLINQGGYLYQR